MCLDVYICMRYVLFYVLVSVFVVLRVLVCISLFLCECAYLDVMYKRGVKCIRLRVIKT